MGLRNPKLVTWKPQGLSDAADGSNSFPGAMKLLANLIPDPTTADCWVCRPASLLNTNFADISGPGFVSCLLVVGELEYGLIASSLHPGFDEPYCYNLETGTFLPIAGITAANVPASPNTTGEWQPPIIAQIGSRIIVCHPGFPGGPTKFGWFDISGFSEDTIASTTVGSPILTGNPLVTGVQPGMRANAVNIPIGATVLSTTLFSLVTTGNTNGPTDVINNLASTEGVEVGNEVVSIGVPLGSVVINVDHDNSQVQISSAITGANFGIPIYFAGSTITLSEDATSTAAVVSVTIAGGGPAGPHGVPPGQPLWGAGDCDRNPLAAQPLCVAEYNGRAYYGLGTEGIQFSDSGFACRISNNPSVQALLPRNGLAVTAFGQLLLSAPLTGGIVAGLAAFQGVSQIQQITGDPTLGNLAMNALPVATGTAAPLSITPSELGTAFVSPQGLRIIGFDGRVSPPVGDSGQGIVNPFIFALYPSRICAASGHDTIRITVINGGKSGNPVEEYWYDISRRQWSGPHTFPASLIQPWRDLFVLTPYGIAGEVWSSEVEVSSGSLFVENSQQLAWAWGTVLLPDNQTMAMNAMIEATLMLAIEGVTTTTVTINALDEYGVLLGSTTITPPPADDPFWGAFDWGTRLWGAAGVPFAQWPIEWTQPLVFKQCTFQISGLSAFGNKIGNLNMRYQILGYQSQR